MNLTNILSFQLVLPLYYNFISSVIITQVLIHTLALVVIALLTARSYWGSEMGFDVAPFMLLIFILSNLATLPKFLLALRLDSGLFGHYL